MEEPRNDMFNQGYLVFLPYWVQLIPFHLMPPPQLGWRDTLAFIDEWRKELREERDNGTLDRKKGDQDGE